MEDANEHLLKIDERIEGEIGYLDLTGKLVAETRHELRAVLRPWEQTGPHRVIARLAALDYIDSAGLAALIGAWKRCTEAGGELALAEVNPQLTALFEVTSIEKFFKIFPTEADAEEYFSEVFG